MRELQPVGQHPHPDRDQRYDSAHDRKNASATDPALGRRRILHETKGLGRNAATARQGRDLPKVDALHYNTEGQLFLEKIPASAVEEFYKALSKKGIRSTPTTKGVLT